MRARNETAGDSAPSLEGKLMGWESMKKLIDRIIEKTDFYLFFTCALYFYESARDREFEIYIGVDLLDRIFSNLRYYENAISK